MASPTKLHVAIVGSGPAAWTAAIYCARGSHPCTVFEGGYEERERIPGGQIFWTSTVENFPGYPEGRKGPDLIADIKKQGEKFGAVSVTESVASVANTQPPFLLTTVQGGTYECDALIWATGAAAKSLGLPSEGQWRNQGVSFCATCDGPDPRFAGQPVVVVGGGDTAMEEALSMTLFCPLVHLVHRRATFRASHIMSERVKKHEKIQLHLECEVVEIQGREASEEDEGGVTGVKLRRSTGEEQVLKVAGYFGAFGHRPNSELVAHLVDVLPTGYIKCEPDSTRTRTPGLFAAGDVKDHVYRQAVTAAGSGCQAALDAMHYLEGGGGAGHTNS